MNDQKEIMLNSLKDEPVAVIQTAYVYAKTLHLYGVDVTKEWLTAAQNAVNLEVAYRKGYSDAIEEYITKRGDHYDNTN